VRACSLNEGRRRVNFTRVIIWHLLSLLFAQASA
jgi:hypothetical protein